MELIDRFDGEFAFLSNFHEAPTMYDGVLYGTSEAAFQAAKCDDPENRKRFIGIAPGKAKRLGRIVTLRPDWEDVKVRIMTEIVTDKFTRNPELAEKLLATGDAKLVEGNYWNDTFWGVDDVTGNGENHLGIILMQVRGDLRKKGNG